MLNLFIAEIFLSIVLLIQLVFNAVLITHRKFNFPILGKEIFFQTIFILICVFLLLLNTKMEGYFSNFLFSNNASMINIKLLLVSGGILILPSLLQNFKLQKLNFFEYFSIFLLSLLALLLLISCGDMLAAYLVIEMQALSFYILASFKRYSAVSTEAGLKYFIIGAFISGLFLFGCSLVYGVFGTLNFNYLQLLFKIPLNENYALLATFLLAGVLLIIITFLFKLAIVPFHFWAPDVYEGAPLSSTIIFSVLPKFALIHFFIQWLSIIDGFCVANSYLLIILGIFSVLVGTFFAIRQKRLKRLIIYSSIAQMGFIIIALSSLSLTSLMAIYFFLIIYLITTILIWTHISLLYIFQQKVNNFYYMNPQTIFLSSLSNFFKRNPLWAFSFLIIFFSVAGIPPLSGFLAKILIFFSLILTKNFFSALLLILISAISVFYYLRVLKIIFFEAKENYLNNENSQTIFNSSFFFINCLIISFLLFLLIFCFIYPTYLLLVCQYIVLNAAYL